MIHSRARNNSINDLLTFTARTGNQRFLAILDEFFDKLDNLQFLFFFKVRVFAIGTLDDDASKRYFSIFREIGF